ncbi:MAG TPA: hypothetical protein VMN79_10195 [Casimicrobiaceae bacterium]|nr:hypothetical protein [Casimicrobiaceae bacterium]
MTRQEAGRGRDGVAALCRELGWHAEARFRQLNDEIRHYPTPIARCDDQLTKLIEQRDRARSELERIAAVADGIQRSASATPALRKLLAEAVSDDDQTAALLARLRAAIGVRED